MARTKDEGRRSNASKLLSILTRKEKVEMKEKRSKKTKSSKKGKKIQRISTEPGIKKRVSEMSSRNEDGFIAFQHSSNPLAPKFNPIEKKDGIELPTPSERVESDHVSPWMKKESEGYNHVNLYLCLHEEILDFVHFISPHDEELQARENLIAQMKNLVSNLWPRAAVETFGSHETQMFLPQSDIDLVIFGAPTGKESLFVLAAELEARDMVSYLEVIDKARIPIVKFVDKNSAIQVDISFNISSGLATADLIKQYMRIFPSFRPLVLVLKYFLAQRELNETFQGGIGSFLLQLMVVSFLQQYRRQLGTLYDDFRYNNLGKLLVEFFTLYGREFNYEQVGISVQKGGFYFNKENRDWLDHNRPFLLSVENPNEPTMDVGKNSYEIRTVQRSFEYARQVLANEIHRRGQLDRGPVQMLHLIIPSSKLMNRTRPQRMGYNILYHNSEKTVALQKQYEARCHSIEDTSAQTSRKRGRDRNSAQVLPHLRWRGQAANCL
uniref:polynucleotide adenylyltransferase n=1 Tax=Albugo laibachii Nc14 TaxID=890382 RepID=F0W4L2_9STRA|nr:Poly(A) RNA polymerase putative [Albugo laibachii Nc14]CCA26462.1 Poly(A) RNA polymerase putative [Albugo laibachii Nc14]|eukprot:CCA26462.1 Poly(A) RNA polymerase putative [Albugo laibachii Nc14]